MASHSSSYLSAGSSMRVSMANSASSSWLYIWISLMLAPCPVTKWTIGSASPTLSGPTAVMMVSMAESNFWC